MNWTDAVRYISNIIWPIHLVERFYNSNNNFYPLDASVALNVILSTNYEKMWRIPLAYNKNNSYIILLHKHDIIQTAIGPPAFYV